MSKFQYRCRTCGEDFESPNRQITCAECISADIVGGEIKEENDN